MRAWDAADLYALTHLAAEGPWAEPTSWLVVNDSFGALAVALATESPQSWTDSHLAQRGAAANLARAMSGDSRVRFVSSVDQPEGPVDVVVVKIPKSLALLEHQLTCLRAVLAPGARVLGAGLARHIHTSTLELFEAIIGPTTTSLAWKKARLIFAGFDPTAPGPRTTYPTTWTIEDGRFRGLVAANHAAVFSRGRLDIGTRFFLEHLPRTSGPTDVIDLGCGNGVLGTAVALENPDARVLFTDDSAMAIASATATMAANLPARPAAVRHTNVLDGVPDASADLVVNNPPFHDQHTTGDAVAWEMFTEARRVLRPGGELYVVGNRHLGYHAKLAKLFGAADVEAANKKFTVLRARKRTKNTP